MYVYASEVAKLIGDNPYEKPDAALLNVLARSPRWRHVVARVREELGLRTDEQVLEDLQAPDVLQQAVQSACAAASETDISTAVEVALDKVRRMHIEQRISRPGLGADDPVAALIAANPQLLETHMRAVAPLVEAAIVKERGSMLEQGVLNGYEKTHGSRVDMRNNQRFQLRTPAYVISGYIDGVDTTRNLLIEVKNRRRLWHSVPAYDLTQMHVYLAMLSPQYAALQGLLVERFPDGTIRETSVPVCSKEWARIDNKLRSIAERVQALTEDDVVNMIK